MKIVSVINQKGGVGKTTTCANLGAALALIGWRTLVIDLDPQANLTLGLGVLPDNLPYRLDSALLNPVSAPLEGLVTAVGDLPLYLIPGHLELARAEPLIAARRGAAYHLREALQPMVDGRQFDWILIDCPPSLGALTQNGIVASSHMLVPTEPKMYAFAGMNTLNQMMVDLSRSYTFQVELLGVVLTMYERPTRLHRTVATVIRERFGDHLLKSIIYKNVRISEAELEGKPVVLFDPKAAGSRDYLALAKEVLARAGMSSELRGGDQE